MPGPRSCICSTVILLVCVLAPSTDGRMFSGVMDVAAGRLLILTDSAIVRPYYWGLLRRIVSSGESCLSAGKRAGAFRGGPKSCKTLENGDDLLPIARSISALYSAPCSPLGCCAGVGKKVRSGSPPPVAKFGRHNRLGHIWLSERVFFVCVSPSVGY